MTKISIYNKDTDVRGNDKWIGSDAQNQNRTKNFTPDNVATYFNENQVIDLGVELRYFYDTLDPLQQRVYGSITFETEIGPQVNFSSISTFLLSKYTMGHNDVSQFLDFLIGSNVILSRSNNINMFGYYKIDNIEPYLPDPNFFVVTLTFDAGNGYMKEDEDYFISLVQFEQTIPEVPTKTSDLINDGEDGVHPFITAEDVPTPTLQSVTDEGDTTNTTVHLDGGALSNSINEQASFAPALISTINLNSGSGATLDSTGKLALSPDGLVSTLFAADDITQSITLQAPNKAPGSYTLATTDDIPAPQVNSDWDATSGVAEILNKPTIPAAVTKTSDLTNDGENGVDPFITAADVPASVTSVGLTMPSAFSVANSPITSSGDIAVTGAGLVSQYVRGDGSLANFPTSTGGGASVNYYLNGSVSQGTFGGATYYQMSKTPILGAGTNFIRTNGAGNGYIASFITDAGDPSFLNIPGGNWNLEFYFQSSSSGGSPQFYGEIYKVSATNVFTLVASGSANPEGITNGTTVDQYFTSIPMPQTSLLITDRLAIRIYVITGGRTITLHTENGNLCEVLTTFTTGLTALNGLTTQVQLFATGTSGTDFGISSSTSTHTFNLPTASAANRGALSSTDWSTFNGKQAALVSGTNIKSINGTSILGSGDLVISGSNIYNANGTLTSARTLTSGGFPLTFTGSNTAASAIARGLNLTHTLVAAANSDVLVGLDIQPTFTTGAFTGVSRFPLRIRNSANDGSVFAVTSDGVVRWGNRIESGNSTGQLSWDTDLVFINAALNLGFRTGGSDRMRIFNTGNVAIATTTDAGFKLDVNGTARVQGTSIFTADATINGHRIGRGGGDVSTNVVVGSAISNNTGSNSTFLGNLAGGNNTSGSRNTYIGYTSGFNQTTGNNNVFAGERAGRYIADGATSNTIANDSIFIGQNTKPLADNQTNQIVIGYNAIGIGSNSVVLGNDSITKTALKGNVLINTTTDAGYRLDVNGPVRIQDNFSISSGFSILSLGNNVNLRSYLIGGSGYVVNAQSYNTLNSSSNEQGFGVFTGIYAPTSVSGTPSFNALKLTPTINQTGGANGITRGLFIDPTLTAAADFRAIENSVGKVCLNTTSGNTMIGTTTDVGFKLDVNGTARVSGAFRADNTLLVNGTSINASAIAQFDSGSRGFLPPRMTTTQKNAIATPAAGLVVYDTTLNKLCLRTAAAWEVITSI